MKSSPNKRSLINQTIEGSIPGVGLNAATYIVGTPGAKFYLNVKDIDDDEIFDLSNVEISASGRYTTTISFPKSTKPDEIVFQRPKTWGK